MSNLLDNNFDIDLKSFINNKLYDYCSKPYSWWNDVSSKCYIKDGYGVKLFEFENIGAESLNNYHIEFTDVDFYNKIVEFKCVEKEKNFFAHQWIKNQNTGVLLTLEDLLGEF